MVDFLLFCVAFIIGLLVTAFGLIQIMIILLFSVPTTLQLHRAKALISLRPLVRDVLSVVIISSIFIVLFLLTNRFLGNQIFGFYIGMVIIVFFGLGQIGGNKNNLADYYENNRKYIKSEYLRDILADLNTSSERD